MSINTIASASTEKAQDRRAVAHRLLAELKPFKRQMVTASAFIILGALAQAGGPWLISRAIDHEIDRGDRSGLAEIMVLLLVTYVIGVLATRGQIMVIGNIGQRILASLRTRLFDQFQHVPLGFFDRRPIGDLISRASNDVDTHQPVHRPGHHPVARGDVRSCRYRRSRCSCSSGSSRWPAS